VKRRNAIKQLGAGLSAGFFLPWMSSCSEDGVNPEQKYKETVAVIGAGAAGLFAAEYLIAKGVNAVVYEASDRLGGRIRTLRPFDKPGNGLWFNQESKMSSDFPVELGADRILGDNSVWANFIKQHKFATLPLGGDEHNLFWVNNQLLSFAEALSDSDFASAYAFYQNLASLSGAGSVANEAQHAGVPSTMEAVLNGLIGNKYGTTNDTLGAAAVAEALTLRQRNGSESLLVNTPMADVLIEGYIRASERTELDTVIRHINYEGQKIVLTGERMTGGSSQPFSAEADKVIITVPVSVLKAGDIMFTPALPAQKQQALSMMDMDASLRVVLDFRRNFWGGGFRSLYGASNGLEYFNPGAGRSTVARTIQVTLSGIKAEQLSGLGPDLIPVLLEELDQMYNGEASANVRRDPVQDNYIATIQDWGNAPFIKGGRSFLKPGGTQQHREVLAAPLDQKVFFAGEASDFTGDAGTVNGALLSGERAAREVIYSLNG
jgi:monoamine oxidase